MGIEGAAGKDGASPTHIEASEHGSDFKGILPNLLRIIKI